MSNALRNYSAGQKAARTATPQRERTPGRTDEVQNNAGGFTFKVSDKDRLERFLILGTDGGTYYVGQSDLTKQNVGFLRDLIRKDEAAVLDLIVDVSVNGRAYKNGPALFALAMLFAEGQNKAAARAAVSKVARTSTHLFEFAGYLDGLAGWGRAKRGAVADWYTDKDAKALAYQAVKYRGGRNGWTHRDLFRKSHPQGVDRGVGNFILGNDAAREAGEYPTLDGFERMQAAGTVKEVIDTLNEYKNLPWETIPTQFLKDPKVWKALFHNGQLNGQALVRNITRLSRIGAFKDMMFAAEYAERLADEEMIARTRLHPINFLNAVVTHQEGQMDRGYFWGGTRNKNWDTVPQIVDALNDGFYTSFKTVEPAGKRTMLAVDVSGSMSSPAMGLDLSCAQVSGALAMTVARTEPAHIIRGFTRGGGGFGRGSADLTDLGITAKTSLNDAMRKVLKNNFGGTDCAQPMIWARENEVEVDTFVVITDNETWAGRIKPAQALVQYRKEMGIDARLAVMGVASTDFTIADPQDRGMLDFCGFDANAPKVLADFSAGRI